MYCKVDVWMPYFLGRPFGHRSYFGASLIFGNLNGKMWVPFKEHPKYDNYVCQHVPTIYGLFCRAISGEHLGNNC